MRKVWSGKETAEALEQLAKQNPLFNNLFSPSPQKKKSIFRALFLLPIYVCLCVWAKLLDSFQVGRVKCTPNIETPWRESVKVK